MRKPTDEDIAIGNGGERVTVSNTWSYHAHLSIYRFALPFTSGRRVLDVGSGAGYGSAYLAEHGASVLGLDVEGAAVQYARRKFARFDATYEVADLNAPMPVKDRSFDVVFSSNVFEHVANVDQLTAECARAVKEDGVVIVAVPPVISAESMAADVDNHFHVHHIPPAAWYSKLCRFFNEVACHSHCDTARRSGDIDPHAPCDPTITELDFEFPGQSVEELNTMPSITAVFVCRRPRNAPLPETLAERTPAAWCESAVAAGAIREARAAYGTETAKLQAQMTALTSSTSWRITAPMRRAITILRADVRTPVRG